MIQDWIALNVTVNAEQTHFQQVQAVTTQPYFITGFVLIFGAALLFALIFGCMSVSRYKIGFQSWMYWKYIILVLIMGIIAFLWFFNPVIFNVVG